jgi:DNA-binding NarL/FixJ family response regulator
MKTKILVADDHKLFRQGLISLINSHEEELEVIGEAETGREAVDLTEKLLPDVVLMDIFMPEGSGLLALKEIKARLPDVSVVMLTSSEEDEHLYESVQLGASGYLLKSLDADELFDLLAGVKQGEAAMTKAMATRLLKGIARRAVDDERGEEALSERELMVLRLVAKGDSNSQIAEELNISVNTVKSHLRNILEKLQLKNRTQVATYAIERGLVSPYDNKSCR